MTTFNTDLNANEQTVLDSLVLDFNGDFGFAEHKFLQNLGSITPTQLSGYVASLQSKGWIHCYTGDPDWKNGFEITEQASKHLGID